MVRDRAATEEMRPAPSGIRLYAVLASDEEAVVGINLRDRSAAGTISKGNGDTRTYRVIRSERFVSQARKARAVDLVRRSDEMIWGL